MTSSFDLTGRTALVTGAARGLGRAIALALADAGADVALGLRDKDADGGLIAAIEAKGRKALPLQMDVLDLKQSYSAIDAAIAAFGHWWLGSINWTLLAMLLIGSVPGITIGSWFARSVPEKFLRVLLAMTLTGVAAKLIY